MPKKTVQNHGKTFVKPAWSLFDSTLFWQTFYGFKTLRTKIFIENSKKYM